MSTRRKLSFVFKELTFILCLVLLSSLKSSDYCFQMPIMKFFIFAGNWEMFNIKHKNVPMQSLKTWLNYTSTVSSPLQALMGIINYLGCQWFVLKAVLLSSLGLIFLWWSWVLNSFFQNSLDPMIQSNISSFLKKGALLFVVLLRAWKPLTPLSFHVYVKNSRVG